MHVGPAAGKLLVSFGGMAGLIFPPFVPAEGKADVMRARTAGSAIGARLLGLAVAVGRLMALVLGNPPGLLATTGGAPLPTPSPPAAGRPGLKGVPLVGACAVPGPAFPVAPAG